MPSLALLGYPPGARLLILNADDYGMCPAVNQAIQEALLAGLLRSATLMAPAPAAAQAMAFLAAHRPLQAAWRAAHFS
jgi:hypothetical protein